MNLGVCCCLTVAFQVLDPLLKSPDADYAQCKDSYDYNEGDCSDDYQWQWRGTFLTALDFNRNLVSDFFLHFHGHLNQNFDFFFDLFDHFTVFIYDLGR